MKTSDVPLVATDNNSRQATISNAAVEQYGPLPVSGRDDISRTMGVILRRITTKVKEISYRQWQFRMPGKNRNARLHVSAKWLRISWLMSPVAATIDSKLIENMLGRNARIKGSPRIIVSQVKHERQLVVDIPVEVLPWDNEAELENLIATEITSMRSALDKKLSDAARPTPAQLSYEQLDTIFEEAGWSVYTGDGDGLEVTLDVPDSYHVARISQDDIAVRLSVSIFEEKFASGSYACRSAVTLLLWLVSSQLRMVKPIRSRHTLELEVSVPFGPVNTALLLHGCAALSVALQQLVAEAELLIVDEHLARIYLSNLGFQKTA